MGIDIDPDFVPKLKLSLHCAQIFLSLVGWCLAIAVFVGKDAKVVRNNGWTFGVFFLTIPAWVYLIMTPRFERTRKWAEPHVMFAVDGAFTIIWLTAFATQAAYNTAGLCGQACNISKGVVAMGILICLLFGATTFVSAYTLNYWKFHGTLPGYDSRRLPIGDNNNIDPDKAAFSMAPHEEEAYERINADDHDNNNPYVDPGRYGHANPYSHDGDDDEPQGYGALPSQRSDLFSQDTEYSGSGGLSTEAHTYGGSQMGSQVSYSDGPAKFPPANYDRVNR